MNGSVFRRLADYRQFLLGLLLLLLTNYIVFYSLFLYEGQKEIVSWLQTESVDLQQGNLLTSFSKFDRLLAYKSDIKSISLIKVESSANYRILAQIGDSHPPEIPTRHLLQSDYIIRPSGIFSFYYYKRLPSDPGMALLAEISSFRFAMLTVLNSIVLSLILSLMLVWHARFRRAEEQERSHFLLGTIRKILDETDESGKSVVSAAHGLSSNEVQGLLIGLHHQKLEKNRAEATSRLAKQVAHDIRSPLSALNVLVGSVQELPDDKRMLLQTVSRRINDIANNLLNVERATAASDSRGNDVHSFIASIALDQIISEKRLQIQNVPNVEIQRIFSGSGCLAFVSMARREFERAVSNILNNAVESSANLVCVSLESSQSFVEIRIEDNGSGISPSALSRIGEYGFSQGKGTAGSGLGVYHAKSVFESAGGTFQIESEEGKGTRVTVRLPLGPVPNWFAAELPLKSCSSIYVIDDDPTIEALWRDRLKKAGLRTPLVSLKIDDVVEMRRPIPRAEKISSLFLIDYEFSGQARTGIDLIRKLKKSGEAFLVTSHFNESDVQAQAVANNVRIVPKQLVENVEIV